MTATPRDLVRDCLTFNRPSRIPRHLWTLPWAMEHYPEAVEFIQRRFPDDLAHAGAPYRPSLRVQGRPYVVGEYVDEWGCTFTGIQAGIIGEIRRPLLPNRDDWRQIAPPYETLPEDVGLARDQVNRQCRATDKFVLAGGGARPWERLQFIRGTENAMLDVMEPDDPAVRGLLKTIHEFYLKELEFWAATEVDALMFMDDWGSQRQLLIPPRLWRTLFKPLYKDYCDLAHAHGKFIFMHSDGCITEIYPDLVELGVDALNSQLFCMDMEHLAKNFKGKTTFWGEIDRQHILPAADPNVGREAVRTVAKHLYDPCGGMIAQFEFGPGANPETAKVVFDEWENVQS